MKGEVSGNRLIDQDPTEHRPSPSIGGFGGGGGGVTEGFEGIEFLPVPEATAVRRNSRGLVSCTCLNAALNSKASA